MYRTHPGARWLGLGERPRLALFNAMVASPNRETAEAAQDGSTRRLAAAERAPELRIGCHRVSSVP